MFDETSSSVSLFDNHMSIIIFLVVALLSILWCPITTFKKSRYLFLWHTISYKVHVSDRILHMVENCWMYSRRWSSRTLPDSQRISSNGVDNDWSSSISSQVWKAQLLLTYDSCIWFTSSLVSLRRNYFHFFFFFLNYYPTSRVYVN